MTLINWYINCEHSFLIYINKTNYENIYLKYNKIFLIQLKRSILETKE